MMRSMVRVARPGRRRGNQWNRSGRHPTSSGAGNAVRISVAARRPAAAARVIAECITVGRHRAPADLDGDDLRVAGSGEGSSEPVTDTSGGPEQRGLVRLAAVRRGGQDRTVVELPDLQRRRRDDRSNQARRCAQPDKDGGRRLNGQRDTDPGAQGSRAGTGCQDDGLSGNNSGGRLDAAHRARLVVKGSRQHPCQLTGRTARHLDATLLLFRDECLAPEAAPAERIAELHHQRSRSEPAQGELKTWISRGRPVLRSQTLQGVVQEVYALLVVDLAVQLALPQASHQLRARAGIRALLAQTLRTRINTERFSLAARWLSTRAHVRCPPRPRASVE